MQLIIDIVLDCIHDTWAMLPLLFITYCILEVFERKQTAATDEKIFFALQKFGPLIGAFVGLIPQCGFSVLVAMLFIQRNVTLGTLIAVMIATSDEAVPVLLSNPSLYSTLGFVLFGKLIAGILVGYLVDAAFGSRQQITRFEDMEEDEDGDNPEALEQQSSAAVNGCSCCYPEYSIPRSAFLRSIRIFGFLFITSLILSGIIEILGQDTLKALLLHNNMFQPLLAALVGFIPNCATTVVLAELFSTGSITLGSLFAGLVTNSGLALLVLIRYGERKRNLSRIITILLAAAVISGNLIQQIW